MNTLLFESVEDVIKRVDEESTPIGDIILTNTKTKKQLIIKNTAEKIEIDVLYETLHEEVVIEDIFKLIEEILNENIETLYNEIDVLYETIYEEVETLNEYNNKTVNKDNVKVTTTKHNNYNGNFKKIDINNKKNNELVNCHKNDVYVDEVFNEILKSNNYDSFYNSYETKFKIRCDGKLHIRDSVYKGTYIDYNDIYPPGTKNNKIIKKSQNTLITVVNRYKNEIYLIYYYNIKKK